MSKIKASSGSVEFQKYYREIYGDRWETLYSCLLNSEKNSVALLNPFVKAHSQLDLERGHFLGSSNLVFSSDQVFVPPKEEEGLLSYYLMDKASLLATEALTVNEGDSYADFCAAPGGKSLFHLFKWRGKINALLNEPSKDRNLRLRKVLNQYLPPELAQKVMVTSHDGRKFGLHKPAQFDVILLDVPCSSERHVALDEKELEHWKPKRSKQLAELQFSILCSALDSLKSGGRMLYSTCSLSPIENEGQIERLLKKRPGQLDIMPTPSLDGIFEKRSYGSIALPDKAQMGPIYACLLSKR